MTRGHGFPGALNPGMSLGSALLTDPGCELLRKLSCFCIFKLSSQTAAKAICVQQSPSAQSQEPQIEQEERGT